MAIVLPYNALVRLTGLNTQGERNLNKINGYRVSSGSTLLAVPTVSGITTQTDIVVNGMSGIPNTVYDVASINSNNKTISIATTPTWSISAVRAYSVVVSATTYYYNSYIINGTSSLTAGDTVNISVSGAGWLLSGTQTVHKSSNTQVVIRSTSVGSPNSYPQLNTNNYATPSITGTITQTATPGTTVRPVGINNAYWSIRSGSSDAWLSDHNRDALDTSFEELEYSMRTADGTLRQLHVASKRTFSLKWSLLPADGAHTVDLYAGGEDLRQIYINNSGVINMEIYNRDSAKKNSAPDQIIPVRIKDFSYSIAKRGVEIGNGQVTDFWDVDLSLEEV